MPDRAGAAGPRDRSHRYAEPNTVHGVEGSRRRLLDDHTRDPRECNCGCRSGSTTWCRPLFPGGIWEQCPGAIRTRARLRRQRRAPMICPHSQAVSAALAKSLIEAPPAQVWRALLDPQTLRASIPGGESVDKTGPDDYRARVRISIAGIGGSYDVRDAVVRPN